MCKCCLEHTYSHFLGRAGHTVHTNTACMCGTPGGRGGGGGSTPIYGLYGDAGGGGRYSHIWPIWGYAAQQGMVFAPMSMEQGLQISVSVWNQVYFWPFRFWNTVGVTFLPPESRCKRMLLLFPVRSCCMFTQKRCFQFESQPCLTFFSLEQVN